QIACVRAFFVPGQPRAGSGAPGRVHQPSLMCERCITPTSPDLCPVRRSTLSGGERRGQNAATSESLKIRERLRTGLRSTPLNGLNAITSTLTPNEKIAEPDLQTAFATLGDAIAPS